MIDTRETLRYVLKRDSMNYRSQTSGFVKRVCFNLQQGPMGDQRYIWKYIKTLRHLEYHQNNYRKGGIKMIAHFLPTMFYISRLKKLAYKTGIQIPINTVGPGLTIWHWGSIVVNPASRIGENVTLYPGVLIGHKKPGEQPPTIGNDCFIGSGAKIIGNITIGNNCTIGQNCVVTKSLPDNSTVVAQPNRVL